MARFALPNPRMVALDLLSRVAESDSYINLLLPSFLSKAQVPDGDRGLIQELSYGTLRWQLQYDTFIDHFTAGKTLSPKLRIAMRLGLHQLFRMRIPAHAAIHETVELVKIFERSAAGMANAVLRNADRAGFEKLLNETTAGKRTEEVLAITHSHPSWVISALKSALELDGKQDQLAALLEANNDTPVINLAALPNTAAMEFLLSQGLPKGEAAPTAFLASGNPESYLATAGVRVQDQGSQLVALALLEVADKSGRWLDMCSGPGGKAAMLQAGLSPYGGILECLEPIPARAELVRQALNPNLPGKVTVGYGQDAKPATYDAVLLDAPCSGLGSVRRKPESRWRKTTEQLSGLTKIQAELIDAAVAALKPGGYLLYSTCSPIVIETNTQIKQALEKHPELELINANQVLNQISPQLAMPTNRKTAQLWTHLHATDAMFIAILRKK
jgi:16S rRNA (cytosine967-C5)-methyltransferase